MDDIVTAMARTRFRRVTWADLKTGDVVYYRVNFSGTPGNALGPLTVGDPAIHMVVNGNGVPIQNFGVGNVTFLVRLPDEPTPVHPDSKLWTVKPIPLPPDPSKPGSLDVGDHASLM